jgi:plasmid maintenance system antidote protein VapI
LASALRLPASRISEIIRGQRGVTRKRRCVSPGISVARPAIWLRLQVAYNLSHAEAEFPAKIAAEVTPRCRVIERSYRDGDNEIAAIAL